MPRLTDSKINSLIAEMEQAASGGDPTFAPWYNDAGRMPAQVVLPLGELTNPGIRGHIIGWKMQGAMGEPQPIPRALNLSAQGLEAAITVNTILCTALFVWRECPEHRCAIIQ